MELIKIQNQNGKETVSARELHSFLEVQTEFKDWIARRIEKFDFVDGLDFCSFLSESSGGRPSKEYYISIEMAKELSMVENNDKGKEARRYFIECEKRSKALTQFRLPETFGEALRMLADKVEENEKQILLIEEQKPAVAFFQKYVDAKNTQCLRDVAKIFGIKQNTFTEKLIKHGMLYRDKQDDLKPIAHYVDNGMIEIKTGFNDYIDKDSGVAKQHAFIQTKLTPAGIAYIAKLIEKNNF